MSLANYQYDAIMRRYNQIQLKNKRLADDRYLEVCRHIPGFDSLKKKEADVALDFSIQMLNGSPTALKDMENALESIRLERISLLKQHSYPEDYLEIGYDCPLCKDTGYTEDNTPCICFKKAAVNLLYDQSLKQDLYEKENFSTFSLTYYSDSDVDPKSGKTMRNQARDAYLFCKRFTENFDTAGGNLIIYGPTGVGKSFLANSIAKALIDSIHSVIHLDAPSFFKQLADYHFRSNEDGSDRKTLYDCDCLIVDDLGAELLNSFVISSLCECVEHRRLSGKATVFTTNLSPSDLKNQYQDRTFSRFISDYAFIRLDGDDIRLLKKNLS